MAEYIEKEKALKALSAGQGCGTICYRAIDRIPATEVEPVTFTKFNHCRGKLVCGNCGWTFAWSEPEMPYCCPFCGARNDGRC